MHCQLYLSEKVAFFLQLPLFLLLHPVLPTLFKLVHTYVSIFNIAFSVRFGLFIHTQTDLFSSLKLELLEFSVQGKNIFFKKTALL